MKKRFVLLVTMFAILLTVFPGKSWAAPNWLKIEVAKWKIRWDDSDKKMKLDVDIRHTNNSKNRVVTQISDKRGKFTIKKDHLYHGRNATAYAVLNLNSQKVSNVELTPGESKVLSYWMNIKSIENGIPEAWSPPQAREFLLAKGWKLNWTYDCSVKSNVEGEGKKKRPPRKK
jgi:prenyltransferase beta subunit